LRLEFLLGDLASLVTAFADDHGNAQPPRDQQRLIAEVGSAAIGFDYEDSASFAAVSAAEHVEANATCLQEFAERDDERGLAGTTGGQVADADYGLL